MEIICSDLKAQYQQLDDLVTGLNEQKWYLKTPFFDWTIFDQLAHIAFFDRESLLCIEQPAQFKKRAKNVLEIIHSSDNWPERFNPMLGVKGPDELLDYWRTIRVRLIDHLKLLAPNDLLAWYGPDMSARSFATARLMETWAHTQDIFDTLRKKRQNGAGLRHVAHIGVSTFKWSFIIRKLKVPNIELRVELSGPGGEKWVWGESIAENRVWGNAEDFCLVVTQRRNVSDTRLKWSGVHAEKWLSIAQAFAGVPQEPPMPGVRMID